MAYPLDAAAPTLGLGVLCIPMTTEPLSVYNERHQIQESCAAYRQRSPPTCPDSEAGEQSFSNGHGAHLNGVVKDPCFSWGARNVDRSSDQLRFTATCNDVDEADCCWAPISYLFLLNSLGT